MYHASARANAGTLLWIMGLALAASDARAGGSLIDFGQDKWLAKGIKAAIGGTAAE